MKRLLTTMVAIFSMLQFTSAQSEGDIRINGGLAYGTEAGFDGGGIGLNIGAEYFATSAISAAPSFTYYFEDTEGPFSAQYNSINIDGRYYFGANEIDVEDLSGLRLYAMAGLSILSVSGEAGVVGPFGGTFEYDDSETGLNIGAGVVYPLNEQLNFNGQIKYQTPGDGQAVLNLGLAYSL